MIKTGNCDLEGVSHRGWVVGHFLEDDNPLRSNDLEIKWGKHTAGESKEIVGVNNTAKSIAFLVKGKFTFDFPGDQQKVMMSKIGDYVYYPEGTAHSWSCVEDGVLLTVRWPSLPGDQKPAS